MTARVDSLAFRPRFDRLDELLLEAVCERNPNAYDFERMLGEPAIGLHELFPENPGLPSHYGRVAKALWTMVDQIFKAADFAEDCPPGFAAKSVQVADIFEVPPAVNSRTVFLALWAVQDEPVLVCCPELPDLLVEPAGSTMEATRSALRLFLQEMCERLNLIVPAALVLAKQKQESSGDLG